MSLGWTLSSRPRSGVILSYKEAASGLSSVPRESGGGPIGGPGDMRRRWAFVARVESSATEQEGRVRKT